MKMLAVAVFFLILPAAVRSVFIIRYSYGEHGTEGIRLEDTAKGAVDWVNRGGCTPPEEVRDCTMTFGVVSPMCIMWDTRTVHCTPPPGFKFISIHDAFKDEPKN
jgi:hypothetical protein